MENEGRADRLSIDGIEGMSCETCFYRVGASCRRYPPAWIDAEHVRPPIVDDRDVCGEWHTDQEPPASFGLAEVAPS